MNEEVFEIIQELEETQAKAMKLTSKLQHKMGGQMGQRGGYGDRFNGPMGNSQMGGYPPMGGMPPMGFPGQMGFREDEMMERRGRDSMGRFTRG